MPFFNQLFFALLLIPLSGFSQQMADTSYQPHIENPAYAYGTGPIVFIDAGHHNFHTRTGRYKPLADLLKRDGYQVIDYAGAFNKSKLDKGDILIISNALHKSNIGHWVNPCPSAFTPLEIEIIKNWISEGGSLFLIADHMPMGGAAKDLAAAFGFKFYNGFAFDSLTGGVISFSRKEGTLISNAITQGNSDHEAVQQITTYTGQAFKVPDQAEIILRFEEGAYQLLPDTAWRFSAETPKKDINGWAQGAYLTYGRGKIVVFGEAAMFSAQLAGPQGTKVGMNAPEASQNFQLLLNTIHWLD